MTDFSDSDLLLQRFYAHCKARPNDVYLTQPHSGGQITEYTFGEVLSEAKRMAGYLKSLGLPAQSKIAMITKNCAHFFMADLAIWMSGHVSVALYPTLSSEEVTYILEHSESKLVFAGKLDTWDEVKKGIPEGMPGIAAAGPQDRVPHLGRGAPGRRAHRGEPVRDADDFSSSSTPRAARALKGVLHSFRTISVTTKGLIKVLDGPRTTAPCPTCRWPTVWIAGCRSAPGQLINIFFAESLDIFVEDLKRAKPTLFVSVPRLWPVQAGIFAKMPLAVSSSSRRSCSSAPREEDPERSGPRPRAVRGQWLCTHPRAAGLVPRPRP